MQIKKQFFRSKAGGWSLLCAAKALRKKMHKSDDLATFFCAKCSSCYGATFGSSKKLLIFSFCDFPHFWKSRGVSIARHCCKFQKMHATVGPHLQVKIAKKLSALDHFWDLRCWKNTCCCDAKHIWKSKSQTIFDIPIETVEINRIRRRQIEVDIDR